MTLTLRTAIIRLLLIEGQKYLDLFVTSPLRAITPPRRPCHPPPRGETIPGMSDTIEISHYRNKLGYCRYRNSQLTDSEPIVDFLKSRQRSCVGNWIEKSSVSNYTQMIKTHTYKLSITDSNYVCKTTLLETRMFEVILEPMHGQFLRN